MTTQTKKLDTKSTKKNATTFATTEGIQKKAQPSSSMKKDGTKGSVKVGNIIQKKAQPSSSMKKDGKKGSVKVGNINLKFAIPTGG